MEEYNISFGSIAAPLWIIAGILMCNIALKKDQSLISSTLFSISAIGFFVHAIVSSIYG